MDQPENFELDVRIRDRLLKVGRIDRQGVEQHLGKLPDLSDRADLVTIAQPALAAETRAAAEPPIALALASEATVRHIEAPPRPVVVEAPEEVEDEDEDEDEDEEPSEPEAAAFGGTPRQAPAIPAVTPAQEQKPSFVAAPAAPPPEPPAPEPPAPEPLSASLSEATLRDPLAAPPPPVAAPPPPVAALPPPVAEPAAVEPAPEPLEAAPETPATSPLRSEPIASTEPAPAAGTAADAPPEEAPAPSSAKPVSVPSPSSAATDGTTEVSDEGWDVPEEPGGNA